ncbi:MAG TPA: DUF4416 family protein [Gemmataceae bacterium]|nr:DUF4416 family protein [Gemmataceae bacterium]
MAGPCAPEPVKFFVAVLWADAAVLPEARIRLAERFGPIDFEGPDHAFDLSDYYTPEMGPGLMRRLMAFEPLMSPEELAPGKLACIAIESALAGAAGRRVNLDVGYLDHNKLVLASIKAAGQKIYLSAGIYADLVARFAQGRYQPFPWTFPDFKDGRYDVELSTLRGRCLEQVKSWRSSPPALSTPTD